SIRAPESLENFESLLQAQVKASAIASGTLPAPPKKKDDKKKDEREDSASRPPDVPRRVAVATAKDEDDEDAAVPVGTKPLSMFSRPLWAFVVAPRPPSMMAMLLRALASGVVLAGACFLLKWQWMALNWDPQLSGALSPAAVVY